MANLSDKVTPSGVLTPTGDGSQLTGIAGTLAGVVNYFAASAAPTGYLKANGATVSRSTYAALFAVVGEVYGAGDGSTTFEVPDLRGEFIRGWDDSRGIDASRVFGSAQGDEFELHGHPSRRVTQGSIANDVAGGGLMIDSNAIQANQPAFTGTPANVLGEHIGGSGGDETRPRNIALLACIKF